MPDLGITGLTAYTPPITGAETDVVVQSGNTRKIPLGEKLGTMPIQSKSADYTLAATDVGTAIFHPASDANNRTFTIPANASVAFPVGTCITFINRTNTVTIAITTDTMYLAGAGTTGSRSLAANGIATLIKLTSTEWIISGVGLT